MNKKLPMRKFKKMRFQLFSEDSRLLQYLHPYTPVGLVHRLSLFESALPL